MVPEAFHTSLAGWRSVVASGINKLLECLPKGGPRTCCMCVCAGGAGVPPAQHPHVCIPAYTILRLSTVSSSQVLMTTSCTSAVLGHRT